MLGYSIPKGFGIIAATNIGGGINLIDGSSDSKSYATYIEVSYGKTVGNIEYGFFTGGVFGDNKIGDKSIPTNLYTYYG